MGSEDGNVNTKKSSKRVKFKDEFGSSDSGSSGHSREGSGGSSNYSDAHLEIIKGSGNKDEVDIHKGTDVESGEISLSSSSSCSSTDDRSRADTKVATSILKKCQNGSAGLTSESQLATSPHESTLTQSPPIQVMDQQAEDFDPYRIPSDVFGTSKSTAPTDWSNASNDSLFSIKVGGTSFARDQILHKRSELSKGESMELVPSPFVAPMVDTMNLESDKKETEVSDVAVKDKTFVKEEPIVEKPNVQVVPWEPPNISNRSDENGTSDFFLDLPVENKIKNKNKEKCAWAFCYCSNYSCALCYCWNCSIKRWCCCSDSEDESNSPKKGKARQKQKQEEKPLASALKSKSVCSKCCSWSWFPSCRRGKRCCC
ncbi:uncharacterized protein LOC120203763 [Hibiscus syriacus]|uniref:uncharacterized protein LOC120203763 n=1 Tax=Hibiscus syriacus TaxID=106335 RepID=UPI001924DBFA|nr:uncharacterized protein LOC120203763 [Hibiscus syriacus]XP_039059875.1 uncharacterized protein LOC120203763 [Hibiscus syriacus]